MQEDPELTRWVESAVVFIDSIMVFIEYLLGVALWAICAAAVADLVEYLRGGQ